MKLALIRQRYTEFGGAELYVSRLARMLVDAGHEVHVLAREWRVEDLDGLVFHEIPKSRGPAFIRLTAFAREAARLVASGGYDLVHSFERTYSQDIFRAGDGCHAEWLNRRARGLGAGRSMIDHLNPRHRAFIRLETRLFSDPRLKIILANSVRGAEEIERHYGVPHHKIRVVYNGVDRRRFHPGLRELHRTRVRRECGLSETEPVVLFVGSGFARKGLADLIRALVHTEVRILVVGRDRTRPYEGLAQRIGAADQVIFLGPQTDVERLYGAADVFVLPSWYDPFANVCLEAMAVGLPVVTSRETGAAEVIRNGLNGYTHGFPVRTEELADLIDQAFIMDRATVIQTNQSMLAGFSWEKNLNETIAVYEEMLARPVETVRAQYN
jgi:UDP-glucose:(heptosyl)LPS alpha-1,3-glucosyltransferase